MEVSGPKKNEQFLSFQWSLFQGLLPFEKSRLSKDLLAGLTLAALGIPEVMGYTKIIGTPVVTGLYTMLLPMLAFAIFGSSRHLVVSADSATAAIVAASLLALSIPNGSPEYMQSVEMIAIIVAGMLLLSRIFRVGFIADFMSRTVLVGFLIGVGIQVAFKQLPHMLGIPAGGENFFSQISSDIRHIGQTDFMSLTVSAITLVVIVGFEKWLPRFPGALLVVIGMMLASSTLHWQSRGLSVIGHVPGGLPQISIPRLSWHQILLLLPTSFSCLIVILAQSAATSRAYALQYREKFNENVDLVGLAFANLAAGCSNAFVVNGSPTKTAMVDSAGGRSQLAQLGAVAIVLAVLLFLTGPLAYLPNAVLASIVFLIAVKLINLKELKSIRQAMPREFLLALVTALTVVVVGVEQGILLAILLSLLQHVRKSYLPITGILQHDEKEKWKLERVSKDAFIEPGIVIYWFGAELFYANSNHFSEEIRWIVNQTKPNLAWLVIDAGGVGSIDYSAGRTLKELYEDLKDMNIVVALTRVDDDLRADLRQLGLLDLIGQDKLFYTRSACLESYRSMIAARR